MNELAKTTQIAESADTSNSTKALIVINHRGTIVAYEGEAYNVELETECIGGIGAYVEHTLTVRFSGDVIVRMVDA